MLNYKENQPMNYVYKMYLFQDESIDSLYQQYLYYKVQHRETKSTVKEVWSNIEEAKHKISSEVLDIKRKFIKKRASGFGLKKYSDL